jgi:hypothetical protein
MQRAAHSSRGVQPNVARRCVITKPRKRAGHSPCWAAEPEKIIINNNNKLTLHQRNLLRLSLNVVTRATEFLLRDEILCSSIGKAIPVQARNTYRGS